MPKQGGLGMKCLVGGYDLSGDIGAFGSIRGGPAALDVTGIDKRAYERIGGRRDSGVEWSSFFNPDANQAHPVLSALPTADKHVMGMVPVSTALAIGDPAFDQISKQIGYDGTRTDEGGFTFALQALGNGYGLEWGKLLTAGLRTDTAATNGASLDTTASAAFGAQAYLQVTAFTGTDVTVKIQDSADDAAWADVTGLTFTAVTVARTTERLATSNTATIRRYLRVATTTSAGFTSVTFAVVVVKNDTAGIVF